MYYPWNLNHFPFTNQVARFVKFLGDVDHPTYSAESETQWADYRESIRVNSSLNMDHNYLAKEACLKVQDLASSSNQADKHQVDKPHLVDKRQVDKCLVDKEQVDKEPVGKHLVDKEPAGKEPADKEPAGKQQADKQQADKYQADKPHLVDKQQVDKQQADKQQADMYQVDKPHLVDKHQVDKQHLVNQKQGHRNDTYAHLLPSLATTLPDRHLAFCLSFQP